MNGTWEYARMEKIRNILLTKLAEALGIELEFVGDIFPKEKTREIQGV